MDIEFYEVPGHPDYVVNRLGVVKNRFTGKEKTWYVQKPSLFLGGRKRNIRRGYKFARFIKDGKKVHIFQHRLLAMLFIPCPGDFKDYIINHINGDGGDNRLENLEWSTYSQNTRHAYACGLQTNVKAVEARCAATGNILSFKSISECADHFKIDINVIYWSKGRVNPKINYAFIIKDSGDTWKNTYVKKTGARQVYSYHVVTKEFNTYPSIITMAEVTGIPSQNIHTVLAKPRDKKIPLKGYIFGYLDGEDHFPKYTPEQCEYFLMDKPKTDYPGWKVIDNKLKTTTIKILDDIAEEWSLSKKDARKMVLAGMSKCGRFEFKRIDISPSSYGPIIE